VEKIGLDYYGGKSCVTSDWKHQAVLSFYMTDQPDAPPMFDICSVVCDTYPEACFVLF
jgi:hypothetical protein